MINCKHHPDYKPTDEKPTYSCLPCLYIWNSDQIRQGKIHFRDNFMVQGSVREQLFKIANRDNKSIFGQRNSK